MNLPPPSRAIPLEAIAFFNKAFDPATPGLQLCWDSTSYKAWSRCHFYYYLTVIQGYVSPRKSLDLTFGLAWHAAMQHFYKEQAAGLSYEAALESTISFALFTQLRTPAERRFAESGSHELALPDQIGRKTPSPKTPRTLIRTLVQYLDKFEGPEADHRFQTLILTDGTPAVELSFRAPIPSSPFSWGGHMDRVISEGGKVDLRTCRKLPSGVELFVEDYKTTTAMLDENYWASYSPDIQMTGYGIGGAVVLPFETSGVQINAIRLLSTGAQFARHLVPRRREQQIEFLSDFLFDMEVVEKSAKQQNFTRNLTACHNDGFGRPCQFRDICSLPASLRQAHLGHKFVRRIWDPSVSR